MERKLNALLIWVTLPLWILAGVLGGAGYGAWLMFTVILDSAKYEMNRK